MLAWHPVGTSDIVNLGFSHRTLWLRTRYTAKLPGKQLLELNNPQHDGVWLYILRNDALPEVRLGGGFCYSPGEQILSSFHNDLFAFDLEAGQNAVL